jgi:hypothetical protein
LHRTPRRPEEGLVDSHRSARAGVVACLALSLVCALLVVSAARAQTISAPAALPPTAASDTGVDETPQLATDGSGTWVAVWSSSGFGA